MTGLSDAAAINAAAGPHWDSIQADPDYPCCEHCTDCPGGHSQPCVRCEQAVRDSADRRAARAMNREAGHVATALVLAVCIFGGIAFLAALKYVGQPAMCKWANQPKPVYCEQVAK